MQNQLKFAKEVMQIREAQVTSSKEQQSERSSGLPRQEEQLSVRGRALSTPAAYVQDGGRRQEVHGIPPL